VLPAVVLPYNADNKTVTWSSAKPKVAAVDAKTGKVKGMGIGKTIVTATTADGAKAARCAVKVTAKAVPLKGLTISPARAGLQPGKTIQIKYKLTPANATGIVPQFKSSNANVAVVDKTGTVTAVGEGAAAIIFTAGRFRHSMALTVGKILPARITLNYKSATVNKGKTLILSVESWQPADADPKKVTWTTSDKNIAAVSASGTVKAINPGRATIIATTWNGKSAKCIVTVK